MEIEPQLKPTLIMPVGLPRSGKSYFFRQTVYPVCCPDEIRRSLGCFPFVAEREPEVWHITRTMVNALFGSGAKIVILDATNITAKRRAEWKSDKWLRCFYMFRTPAEVCLARAVGDEHLIPVIHRMDAQKEWPTVTELEQNEQIIDVESHQGIIANSERFWRNDPAEATH